MDYDEQLKLVLSAAKAYVAATIQAKATLAIACQLKIDSIDREFR